MNEMESIAAAVELIMYELETVLWTHVDAADLAWPRTTIFIRSKLARAKQTLLVVQPIESLSAHRLLFCRHRKLLCSDTRISWALRRSPVADPHTRPPCGLSFLDSQKMQLESGHTRHSRATEHLR